jgi:hypothetical protein
MADRQGGIGHSALAVVSMTGLPLANVAIRPTRRRVAVLLFCSVDLRPDTEDISHP